MLEVADGLVLGFGVDLDGGADGGFAGGEVKVGAGIELSPAVFDLSGALAHFDVDGEGFDGAAADGAPEVANGEFGEDAVEVGGGLKLGLDGLADEGEELGVFEVEEEAGVAAGGEEGAIGLALDGAGLGWGGCGFGGRIHVGSPFAPFAKFSFCEVFRPDVVWRMRMEGRVVGGGYVADSVGKIVGKSR